jgi:hypothetical protein
MIDYDLYSKIKHAEAAGHTPPQIARTLDLHVQTCLLYTSDAADDIL